MEDKRKQTLYFPRKMLTEIQNEASRQDRSMSYIVQFAWKNSVNQIASSDRSALSANAPSYGDDKQEQALYFPESMLADIQGQAVRLDTSLSWVVQAAFVLAREAIAALPSVSELE